MSRFLLRRFIQSFILLIAVSMVTFTLLRLAPNSPFSGSEDPNASAEDAARRREQLGLNDPIPVQYIKWVSQLAQGNLGQSYFSHTPVAKEIGDRLPNTLILNFAALILSWGIGVPLGVYAALNRGSWIDNLVRIFSTILSAVPGFWLGLLAVIYLGGVLQWFPQGGMYNIAKRDEFDLLDRLHHLVLPSIILAAGGWVGFSRVMRSETLEVLRQDYVRTALGKGLSNSVVLWKHILRNASMPLVTASAGVLPGLFSGAAFVEIVFSWPGLGRLSLDAALKRDFPVILATWLIASTLVLVGRMVADLLYGVVDPRVRLK